MLVTLSDMKTYLDISTSDHDAFLTSNLELISSVVENYCGRKFASDSYIQTFYKDEYESNRASELLLYHFPVTEITQVLNQDDEEITEYRVHWDSGNIKYRDSYGTRKNFFSNTSSIEITYTAGYSTIPLAIQEVVKLLVAERFNKSQAGVNIDFGNNVQRLSVAGVMSIDFDYTLQSNERSSKFGMILGNYANVLDFYRSERAISGEIKDAYVT